MRRGLREEAEVPDAKQASTVQSGGWGSALYIR